MDRTAGWRDRPSQPAMVGGYRTERYPILWPRLAERNSPGGFAWVLGTLAVHVGRERALRAGSALAALGWRVSPVPYPYSPVSRLLRTHYQVVRNKYRYRGPHA